MSAGERSPYAEDAYRNWARSLHATYDSRTPAPWRIEIRTPAGEHIMTCHMLSPTNPGDTLGVLIGRDVWIEAVDVAPTPPADCTAPPGSVTAAEGLAHYSTILPS